MPIDIANFVARNFQGPDFEGAARLKMYGQESQRRNMLTQMQIDAANEERAQRQALLGIIRSSTGPDGAFDYEGAANAVLQSTGDLDTATKLRAMKGSGTLEKMSQALKAAEYFRETSLGVKTPEQYQAWWSEVDRASREMGVPNTLPQTYDPAALKAWQTKQTEEYGPIETVPGLGVVQRGPGGQVNVLRAEERGGGYAPSEMEKSYNFLAQLYGPEKAAEMVGQKYVGSETAPKRERVTDEGTGMNYLVDERGVAQPVVVPTREKRGSRGMGTREVTRYQPLVTRKLEKPEYRTLNEGDDNESIVAIQDGKASRVEVPQAASAGELPDMPPAAEHTGRVVRDTTTNKRYKSDGTKWVEL